MDEKLRLTYLYDFYGELLNDRQRQIYEDSVFNDLSLGEIAKKREEELTAIIAEQKLKPEETKTFIENSFRDGILRTTGTDIDKILPPTSRFGGGNRSEVKKNVIERLKEFFEKYFGV